MEYIENEVITSLTIKLVFLKGYVDDVIACITKDTAICHLHNNIILINKCELINVSMIISNTYSL